MLKMISSASTFQSTFVIFILQHQSLSWLLCFMTSYLLTLTPKHRQSFLAEHEVFCVGGRRRARNRVDLDKRMGLWIHNMADLGIPTLGDCLPLRKIMRLVVFLYFFFCTRCALYILYMYFNCYKILSFYKLLTIQEKNKSHFQ